MTLRFYPVFPPQENAADVVAWLRAKPVDLRRAEAARDGGTSLDELRPGA